MLPVFYCETEPFILAHDNQQKEIKMAYIATTIKNVVTNMINRTAFLPAIQREFVWWTDDIEKLFDSIMCQYPISSMLFWKIRTEKKKDWVSYYFFKDFDASSPHNAEANLNSVNNDIYLVLDGQQRLTAMSIGLLGSFSFFWYKQRKTKLYINLLAKPKDSPSPDELTYSFSFRESKNPDNGMEQEQYWYEVGDVLNYDDAETAKEAIAADLSDVPQELKSMALKTLGILYARICANDCINYYEEFTDNYDKIVEIFIRANTGGKKLSYSDILLSTATAKWRNLNAREEIHRFTDELENDSNFTLGQDLIMKGAMYLTDGIPIKYQVRSFTRENLEKIEDNWENIKDAFREAVKLISSFGFRDRNLVSKNLILPIALYIYLHYKKNYATETDRDIVRNQNIMQRWFVIATLRSLLQSSQDDKLKNMQRIICDAARNGERDFPFQKLNEKFEVSDFSTDDIDALLRHNYATQYSYLILSLIYPNRDWKDAKYNEDHIYPKTTFTEKKLRQMGLTGEQIEFALANYNTIANLELLTESENKRKNDAPFNEWITGRDTSFKERHCIPDGMDYTYDNFKTFIERRKKILHDALERSLTHLTRQ